MNNNNNDGCKFNMDELDEIIVGRVKPHIYAFSTNTIPNYLKIGDTYRPVKVRLDEWRKKYTNLSPKLDKEAMVTDDTFFRDYAVHDFLENDLGKKRLTQEETPEGEYFSNEFFKDATTEDVELAISDIKDDFDNNTQKYQYYSFKDRPTPIETEYRSTGMWTPRPNQQEVIDNFKQALEKGRTKLLLYAVMRFGKTFTAMCCANEMDAKIVLVVSAKADVKEEWRMTIQSADNFDKYVFVDSEKLKSDEEIIKNTLANGRRVVVFLTLQDLKDKQIKDKHKEVFGNKIDLLLVDETHFGARAEVYGRVLRDQKEKEDDFVDFQEAGEEIKVLHPRIAIHLSGTPYRILMSTEFEKDDIIGFYQASDILDAKKDWDEEHFGDIENQLVNPATNKPYQEWDNPYFGFPQMVRFAFTPSKRIRNRLVKLQEKGIKSKFDEIFRPKSTRKQNDGSHKEFVYADDILEFLEVIDGAREDDSLLSFLNYNKIIDGSLCHHMVFVLPYRASCDALQKLINDNAGIFHNLNNYEIINISGVDEPNKYSIKSVKRLISKAESEGKKTITLTVNRMLTGSTVPEWDTMLYLKDTRSPQEYDQATFRLQNQYVTKYKSEDSNDIVKYDKKPQTLLIDFSPNRIFLMQEERSLVYNANVAKKGKNSLIDQISKDISYSPIIMLDKNRMRQVGAIDLLSAIDNYSKDRGIYDEAQDIPIDFGLLNDDDIRKEIEKQGEFRGRQGFEVSVGEDDDEDITEPQSDESANVRAAEQANEPQPEEQPDLENQKTLERQFKTYYSRILFYSALTESNVASLQDIIESLDGSDDNKRILHNLGLNAIILQKLNSGMDAFALYKLDNTISRINKLSNDDTLTPLERAQTALKQFDRLSDSEVVTPQPMCHKVLTEIGQGAIKKIIDSGGRILDIASKKAEFAASLADLMGEDAEISNYKDSVYSIPTSKIAYEFTRKIYQTLGLNVDNIADDTTSYDLVLNNAYKENWKNEIAKVFHKEGGDMKFDAIVGNPPYNISDGGAQASAQPIYQYFVELANKLSSRYTSMIIPTRWFVGGKGLDDFRKSMLDDKHIVKIHDYLVPNEIFPNTNIRGGVCYFIRDKQFDNTVNLVDVTTHENDGTEYSTKRKMRTEGFDVFIRDAKAKTIIDKITKSSTDYMSSHISPLRPFGIRGYFAKSNDYKTSPDGLTEPYPCYSRGQKIGYVEKKFILNNTEWLSRWKVFMPRANNIGTELNDDNLNTFVGKPEELCTESYLVIGADDNLDEEQASNIAKYFKTKFVRFLHSLLKGSQDATSKTFKLVPAQDFSANSDIHWSKTLNDIDAELFSKYGFTNQEINLIERRIKDLTEEM